MSLETASYIHQLVAANPPGSDRIHQGDDHIRMIKAALKATFPNITGPMTLTQAAMNALPAALVPYGIITLWYGADTACPAGWAVCNGQTVAKSDGSGNVTVPDLRGRVAIGANGTYAQGTAHGSTSQAPSTDAAGAHTHPVAIDGAGAHTHTATASVESPGAVTTSNRVVDGSGSFFAIKDVEQAPTAHSHVITTASAGSHSHAAYTSSNGSHNHTVPAFSVIQPSLALHHIMKI